MKKALMAAALFAAVTSASAATVSVYGVMDMGVSVSKKSGATGDNRWNLQMKSGMRNSSRFGLKGFEDLGNNYKVGFYGFAQQNQEKTSDDTVKRNRGMEFTAGMVHYF